MAFKRSGLDSLKSTKQTIARFYSEFFVCVPDIGRRLGGKRPLWGQVVTTISLTVRVSVARRNLKEAESKILNRGIRTA